MGKYDEEAEVQVTAEAIEAGESVSAFGARIAVPGELSPLDLLLRGGPSHLASVPPPPRTVTLFDSDFAYVREVLDMLAESEGLKRTVDEKRNVIELHLPPATAEAERERHAGIELRRRYRKLPVEVLPEDGVIVMTPDRMRVQDEIKLARDARDVRSGESSWPKLSYLWPLHPVMDWCIEKGIAPFGRQEAPVSLIVGRSCPG